MIKNKQAGVHRHFQGKHIVVSLWWHALSICRRYSNRWAMLTIVLHLVLWLPLLVLSACGGGSPPVEQLEENNQKSLFEVRSLVAWCVVPFDKMERTPRERAKMLKELGFTKLAYDWRDHHLPTFPEEVKVLREHDIELVSVWWWIDGKGDSLLNKSNQQLLRYLDSLDVKCDIWMSFSDDFFDDLHDSLKLSKAVESVKILHGKAASVGAKLQLYNHGQWFGDPRNQVRIIKESGLKDLGIIYNFHHGHQQIDEFPRIVQAMMPYLNTVNINGMRKEGPKILDVGAGDSEKQMLNTLLNAGFQGSIGIIGHLEDEDVKLVLQRNIQGLQEVVSELDFQKQL